MNSLKNLMIIAVLAAVGYGVYVSLARNNVEEGQPPVALEGWPAVPKVELPSASATTPPGGPIAYGSGGLSLGGATPLCTPAPVAPASPSGAPLGTGSATAATPYPSSGLPPMAPPATSFGQVPPMSPPMGATASPPSNPAMPGSPAANPTTAAPSSPMATLGAPVAPDAVSALSRNAAASYSAPSAPAASQIPSTEVVNNLSPPPNVSATSVADPPPPNPTESLLQSKFASFMEAVQKKLDEGKLAEAHLALSTLYGNPDLPAEQAKQITDLLDQLAGTVIYSRKHYLEPAYVTAPGDTLEKIAQRYSVPWQLLARINGLLPLSTTGDSAAKDQPLPVGKELKVVRGPFEAVVRLDKRELTLMLQNRYAGRFPIGVGRDQPTLDGSYTVHDKTLAPTYYSPDGTVINPNDPKNPLGSAWIGLTDRVGIHGTSDSQALGRDDNRGTICLSDRDVQDLYGILALGSRVTVMR